MEKRRKHNEKLQETPDRNRRSGRVRKKTDLLFEILKILLLAVLISFFVSSFIFSSAYVDGQSMSDTIHNGDRVLVVKWGNAASNLERGDIVVFHAPDENKDYIKRIVGMPNEYVEIENGLVYINGRRLEENYINTAYTGTDRDKSWYVPANSFFVLGDNRKKGASRDSRVFGPVSADQMVGRVTLRYFPFSRYGRIDH